MFALTLSGPRLVRYVADAEEFSSLRFGELGGVECQVFSTLEEMIEQQADIAKAQLRSMALQARIELEVRCADAGLSVERRLQLYCIENFVREHFNAHRSRR